MNPGVCVTLCIRKADASVHGILTSNHYQLILCHSPNSVALSSLAISLCLYLRLSLDRSTRTPEAWCYLYNFRSESIFRTDYSSKHGRPYVFTAGRTRWGARHSSARDSVKGCITCTYVYVRVLLQETDLSKTSVKYGLASSTVGYLHRG